MEETDKRIGGLAVFGYSPTEVCQWEQDCEVSVYEWNEDGLAWKQDTLG